MTDTASAIPYGSAALGQGLFATGTSTANWAYSPWDATSATATVGAGAGTSPPAAVTGSGSTPIRGSLTWGTGTSTATGTQVTVAFGATLPSVPVVVISPTTIATGTISTFVTSLSTTGFAVQAGVAPSASQGNTVFGVNWVASL